MMRATNNIAPWATEAPSVVSIPVGREWVPFGQDTADVRGCAVQRADRARADDEARSSTPTAGCRSLWASRSRTSAWHPKADVSLRPWNSQRCANNRH
jgi:hypothetical protein